ncbi:MAG: zinc ribbon domain-containing protein [Acholeplasmatales bacterium]|nr:zinc ribbon domain-containing protein [Acholeplasmatales bacterium]
MYDEYGFGASVNGKRIGLVKSILVELLILVIGLIIFVFVATPVKTTGTVLGYYQLEQRDEDHRIITYYEVAYSYTINGKEYRGTSKNPLRSYTEGENITVYTRILVPSNSTIYNESVVAFIILGACGGFSLVLVCLTLVSYGKYRKMLKEREYVESDPEALERKRLEDLRAMAGNTELATKQCPYCNTIIGLLDDHCPSCGADLSQNVEE